MNWLVHLLAATPSGHLLRLDLLVELLLSTILGGAIGWEREASGKPAGLRTNILICLGATLLADLSIRFSELTAPGIGAAAVVRADPGRIAAQIVTGVGFLGAGTILQAKGSVTGLTTAATLWVVAAIGMAVGSGAFVEATGTTLLVLLVLMPLAWVEGRVEVRRRGRVLRVVVEDRAGVLERIQEALEDRGLAVKVQGVERDPGANRRVIYLDVGGDTRSFRTAREELLERDDVLALYRE